MVEARFRFAGRCVTGSRPEDPNPRVAPNFSLREFVRQDGTFFVHPNLILTLQNIRNLHGGKLRRALKWLQTVWPQPITDLRCFCALFDLCTQQGSLDKAHSQIETRIAQEKPKKQQEVVQIAVGERARTADPPWRAASMSRRLRILYDAPVSATESGKTANTDNPYFSLLPEMEVQGIQQFLTSS